MKKSLLLTGHSGFLGKILLDEFNRLGYLNVFTLSRSFDSKYPIDLSKGIPEFDTIFDIVVHCAGIAHTFPNTENESALFTKINVIGTSNLLQGLLNVNTPPKQFVFISSVSVYGLIEGLNIDETSLLLAEEPYGKSKIEAEEIIEKWCFENNVICTILRLPLVVGENPPGNLGAMIRAIRKGYYFNINGGKAKKSMVLASDIAKFIFKAADVGGTFNLTDGIHPTFNELSKEISLKFGKVLVPNLPWFLAILLAKVGDIFVGSFPINSVKLLKITNNLTFDDSKARRYFGWDPNSAVGNIRDYL